MRITGTRFHLVETPRETGAISEHLLVRVDTDEGLSGWGEWSDLAHGHPANFPNFPLLVPEGPGLGVQVDEEHLGEIAYKGTRLRQLREGR